MKVSGFLTFGGINIGLCTFSVNALHSKEAAKNMLRSILGEGLLWRTVFFMLLSWRYLFHPLAGLSKVSGAQKMKSLILLSWMLSFSIEFLYSVPGRDCRSCERAPPQLTFGSRLAAWRQGNIVDFRKMVSQYYW